MEAVITFFIAFFFSFIGTIPPGTLNLSVIQMGLEHRVQQAWRFSLAACVIEYIYGWIAVEFETLITSSTSITENFELITAIVMLVLGTASLMIVKKPTKITEKFRESGVRRGLLLGILNPMALPFWVAMTAYVRSRGWVTLDTTVELHAYLLGIALGGFALLMAFFLLARKLIQYFEGNIFMKKIPGITLLVLGVYALISFLV
jgi:threonine/homoserine/homoserine lactone efflux protein